MALTDRDLLLALFAQSYSLDGDTDADPSDWTGVEFNDEGRVVTLNLEFEGIPRPARIPGWK